MGRLVVLKLLVVLLAFCLPISVLKGGVRWGQRHSHPGLQCCLHCNPNLVKMQFNFFSRSDFTIITTHNYVTFRFGINIIHRQKIKLPIQEQFIYDLQ